MFNGKKRKLIGGMGAAPVITKIVLTKICLFWWLTAQSAGLFLHFSHFTIQQLYSCFHRTKGRLWKGKKHKRGSLQPFSPATLHCIHHSIASSSFWRAPGHCWARMCLSRGPSPASAAPVMPEEMLLLSIPLHLCVFTSEWYKDFTLIFPINFCILNYLKYWLVFLKDTLKNQFPDSFHIQRV